MHWTSASRLFRRTLLGIPAFSIALVTPAIAADEPRARLISCGEESCLLVSGRRPDAASQVTINGRAVTVDGGRKWRVRVPVNTLRQWSAPFAQTIRVSVAGVSDETPLPIGMFLGSEHLAMLTVTAK